MLPPDIQARIFESSPFAPVPLPSTWKNDAKKHLSYTVCKGMEDIANNHGFANCRRAAEQLLDDAIELHARIESQHVTLKDETASYQSNWRAALTILAQNHADDFEFLDMLLDQ